ncbi:MAG: rhodanese-like domain-containing protein [Acidobacteria bacterium]|nr:rhodanese-like domain-containing protein [Acidobacteriota bacterium]
MPTYTRDDGKPIVQFDATLEISPFALLRRLLSDRPPILIDGRPEPHQQWTLAGSLPYPGSDWAPAGKEQTVVVFDDHGGEALEMVLELRKRGYPQVYLLFGGLELYEFSLDPEITGQETFLVRL